MVLNILRWLRPVVKLDEHLTDAYFYAYKIISSGFVVARSNEARNML